MSNSQTPDAPSRALLLLVIPALLQLLAAPAAVAASPEAAARRLQFELTGRALPPASALSVSVVERLRAGDALGAARLVTAGDDFLNYSVRQFAAPLASLAERVDPRWTDATLLVACAVAKDLPFGSVIDGAYRCNMTDAAGAVIAPNDLDFEAGRIAATTPLRRAALVQVAGGNPEVTAADESQGLFSTRGWAAAVYTAGTNRRPVQQIINRLFCSEMDAVRTLEVSDDWVGRDVERFPGGNAEEYLTNCKGCHGTMDALRGAFAYYDAASGTGAITYNSTAPHAKYARNPGVFPTGFVTRDNGWELRYRVPGAHDVFGWDPARPVSGRGTKPLAEAIAHASGFHACMVKRVFRQVCGRDAGARDAADLARIVAAYQADGQKLRVAFELAATLPQCLGGYQ